MERNTMQDNKFFMGEKEFIGLIKALIGAYRFRNQNQDPEAIVIPQVFEVDGVKVEFPTKEDGELFREYSLEQEEGTSKVELPKVEVDIEGTEQEPGEFGNPDS